MPALDALSEPLEALAPLAAARRHLQELDDGEVAITVIFTLIGCALLCFLFLVSFLPRGMVRIWLKVKCSSNNPSFKCCYLPYETKERYEEMLRPARQRLHGWLARRVSYAGPFTARQVEYCCPTMWICRRYGSCCDDYAKCTMVVGNCLSDHIDISMDVYEVTFPDAPPGSIHEKVKSDAPVQYSASLVAKLLGERGPAAPSQSSGRQTVRA